ncbi:MAG: pyridoxine 5'-phosphate synthase [Bacteroidetes bacterium]|nr:pyridoxine 5'-phosphate synthase [Bacteroidota bacterium]
MTVLSVNLNKVALLRNSRGGNFPDLLTWADACLAHGAQGITVHPRPDERHVRYADVRALKAHLPAGVELNVEGYPSEDFMALVLAVRPAQVTLVPDPPQALTSSEGWDTLNRQDFLQAIVARLHAAGIRTSLFVAADPVLVRAARDCGTDRVELYTGPYAAQYPHGREAAIASYVSAAQAATAAGLGLNAGHDLNLDNLAYFRQHIPQLLEVSIGHALTVDALYRGVAATLEAYRQCLI